MFINRIKFFSSRFLINVYKKHVISFSDNETFNFVGVIMDISNCRQYFYIKILKDKSGYTYNKNSRKFCFIQENEVKRLGDIFIHQIK